MGRSLSARGCVQNLARFEKFKAENENTKRIREEEKRKASAATCGLAMPHFGLVYSPLVDDLMGDDATP
jgi:hypothetical protein